jgi:hypothetical protein
MAAGKHRTVIRQLCINGRQVKRPALCRPFGLQFALLALLVLSLLLSACSPQPDSQLADYHDRLQRVFALELPTPAKSSLPALPAVALFQQPLAEAKLDLSDFLALDYCNLQTLVGERNNVLGKVATDAVSLQYELKLLATLQPCLDQPQSRLALGQPLYDELTQLVRLKQQQLPQRFVLLLGRDPTLRQQLQGANRGFSSGVSDTAQALRALIALKQQIAAGQYQDAATVDISQALGMLYQSQTLADLQHSLRLSADFFGQLHLALQAIPPSQLCRADPQIADNLLQQIFIKRLQPELAALDGAAQQLLPLLQQLYQAHPLQAAIDSRFIIPRQQLQQALRQHVSFWQRVRQCKANAG